MLIVIIIIIVVIMACFIKNEDNKQNTQYIETFLDNHNENHIADFSPYSRGFNVSKDPYYPQSLWYRDPYSIYLWENMFWKHKLWNNSHRRQFFSMIDYHVLSDY